MVWPKSSPEDYNSRVRDSKDDWTGVDQLFSEQLHDRVVHTTWMRHSPDVVLHPCVSVFGSETEPLESDSSSSFRRLLVLHLLTYGTVSTRPTRPSGVPTPPLLRSARRKGMSVIRSVLLSPHQRTWTKKRKKFRFSPITEIPPY